MKKSQIPYTFVNRLKIFGGNQKEMRKFGFRIKVVRISSEKLLTN